MDPIDILIDDIYIPAKHRRRTVDRKAVEEIAESILEAGGLKAPILVRPDGARYVLVSGLHRLEACKALGEETISGLVVQARKH
jgi:ParB-like chromosome segregation protein Spo0J